MPERIQERQDEDDGEREPADGRERQHRQRAGREKHQPRRPWALFGKLRDG